MTLYVNGEAVDAGRIAAEAEKMRPRYEQVFADMPADDRQAQLQEWARENVIEAVLMRQAALRDVEPPPDEVVQRACDSLMRQGVQGSQPSAEELRQLKEDVAARLRIERLVARVTSKVPEPTEKDIRRQYEQDISRFTIPEMVRARHIVKHPAPAVDPEAAEAELRHVRLELLGGADFAEMALRHSDCPDNGGDLGFFARGQMVQAFDDVVFALKPGEISEVFRTDYGVHIAVVTERRPAIPCGIEDVRAVIAKELTEAAQQKALERFTDAEKEKAVIEER